MHLSHITITGFKSFAKKTTLDVTHQITGVVGPNGSGKSNIAESIRFVLGEQSMKSMRGKIGSDIIFKGSEHLGPLSRASVTMVIDNKEKSSVDSSHINPELAPYLVYDELTLSRVIFADGTSDYLLNDAKIRLKDVQELLSFAGIGGSAHTIINQGEADKILLASPKDRKEALIDALGLRVYHIRLQETNRKLEKVKQHVHEVELLRKEIKPHLDHLHRQVKKIESQEEERKNLHRLLISYLTREEEELNLLRERIDEQGSSSSLLLITESIQKELNLLKSKKEIPAEVSHTQEKNTLQAEMRVILERKEQISKTIGRLYAEKAYLEKELNNDYMGTSVTISHSLLNQTHNSIQSHFLKLENALEYNDLILAKSASTDLKSSVENFFLDHSTENRSDKERIEKNISTLTETINSNENKEKELSAEMYNLQEKIDQIDINKNANIRSLYEEEKKVMILESKLRELNSTIQLRKQEENEHSLRTDHFNALLHEGISIVGKVVMEYKEHQQEERFKDTPKHDLMRAIERSKLRIEEAGVPNREEVINEYNTTKEREEYLTKELSDIEQTEQKLLELISTLTETLSEKFSSGVTKVSSVFTEFFGEVFTGGKGKLSLIYTTKIDEEGNEIKEQGIDIDVSLPNKKVKEISMFSGGERALVSIALLFAMSQVAPPPFMVLDETDAPLDEANARKYGAMLKRLAEKSKLLVITHNRETMNHCDMLYGVTLGVDGGSRLLSIDFKQAEEFAQ